MADEFESSLLGVSLATLSHQTSLLSTESETETSLNVTREELDKRQLMHSIRLLKLEIAQKNLVVDSLKAEKATRIDDLREKLAETTHEKQILQLQLENALEAHRVETRRLRASFAHEIDALKTKQDQLDVDRSSVEQIESDLIRQIFLIDEEEHREMTSLDPASLTVSQRVQLEIYRLCMPLRTECAQLRNRLETESGSSRARDEEAKELRQALSEKSASAADLEMTANRFRLRVQDLESQIMEADYKRINYDRVKNERDELEKTLMELQHAHSLLEVSTLNAIKDKETAEEELSSQRQKLALLQQDKEYLTKQIAESTNRARFAEERAEHALTQLVDAKRAREELYEKFLSTREKYRSDSEQRFGDEVERLRVKTCVEMDQLKASMKEVYEREKTGLREARDLAIADRQKAVTSLQEVEARANQLASEVRRLQLQLDSKTGELQSDLRLKSFETERAQLVLEEQSVGLKKMTLENEKLREKLDVMTKEFYALQSASDKRISELEAKCSQQGDKLTSFEKLETELDETILQAAEISDDAEAERVLFSYGYGANVPSTAKRRLQHSVHMARRVLQLERTNALLKKDVDKGELKIDQLSHQLDESNHLLEQSQQPYNYLVDTIRTRDRQIGVQKRHLETLEDEVKRLKNDKAVLLKTKNSLSADLERLLHQREEIAVVRKSLVGLQAQSTLSAGSEYRTSNPPPTVFTKEDVPNWYARLRQKHPGPKLKIK